MLGIAKEMADRLIEFLLRLFKGESAEDQLTKALKACVLIITLLILLAFSMLLANINLRMELVATEEGLTKIDLLFNGNVDGPLSTFLRINDTLNEQIGAIRDQNLWLVRRNSNLSAENSYLKRHLVMTLIVNSKLNQVNNILLARCTP